VSLGIDLEGHVDAVAGPSGYLREATPAPRPQRETPTLARRWHSAVPSERCRSLHLDELYQTGGVVRVAAGVAGFVEGDGRGADPQGDVSLESRIHHAVLGRHGVPRGLVPNRPGWSKKSPKLVGRCWSSNSVASLRWRSAAKSARKNSGLIRLGNANGAPRKLGDDGAVVGVADQDLVDGRVGGG